MTTTPKNEQGFYDDCGACHGSGIDRWTGECCTCAETRRILATIKNNRSYFDEGPR